MHMHIFCHGGLSVSTGTHCLFNVTTLGDGKFT